MLQNTFKSRKFTVRIWDNVGVIIPKFDQNFEINSKKFKLCHFFTKIIDAQFSPMRALPLSLPARALQYPSQSGDLKVKCLSNRTLNVNGPLILVKTTEYVWQSCVRQMISSEVKNPL